MPELPVLDPLVATLIAAAVCAFAILAAVLAAHRGNADPKWDRVTVRAQMRQARRERTRMTLVRSGTSAPVDQQVGYALKTGQRWPGQDGGPAA